MIIPDDSTFVKKLPPLIKFFCLLFDDDERLQGERRSRAIREGFIIAKPQPGKGPFQQVFSYELKL